MADVKPFRAVRYDEAEAGPLERLVAPPYDVISPGERERYRALDPHNVVHLTLPDSEEAAARLWREWLAEGVLVHEREPACWALEQDYVGPDGVARTRRGLVASLLAEPYETGAVLPHERTHAGPKEGRRRLLRAVGAQLEPIFLLYDGEPPVAVPDRAPDLAAEGARLWRVAGDGVAEAFAGRELLIADGHHRYESTVAEGGRLLVVLVSTGDPGLMIFPTHRVFTEERRLDGGGAEDVEAALARLDEAPAGIAAVVQYDGAARVVTDGGRLDVELVDSLGHDGLSYTPDWREAVRRVDEGEAAVAYLMRPTRIEDVFAVARRGETMPQKSTYFYPKLLSGLLFHPA